MEKDKVILSDDELKDVAGGLQCLPLSGPVDCARFDHFKICLEKKQWCYWKDGQCHNKE